MIRGLRFGKVARTAAFLVLGTISTAAGCARRAHVSPIKPTPVRTPGVAFATQTATCTAENPVAKALLHPNPHKNISHSQGLPCLQLFIREGNYMQFYRASRELAESDLPEAETAILHMIQESELDWEKALGLILLGSRVAAKKAAIKNLTSEVAPFLSSKSQLLQFCAAVSLLRMWTPENKVLLEKFAQKNKGKPISGLINNLFSYYPSSLGVTSFILFDWPDPGVSQTSFFRHPEAYNELLNDLRESRSDKYSIWDIGSSLGLSTESLRVVAGMSNKVGVKIVGTDINPFSLIYAGRGKHLLDGNDYMSYWLRKSQTEKQGLVEFAKEHGWNVEETLKRFFNIQDASLSALGKIYVASQGTDSPKFLFDDIGAPFSLLPDAAFDAIVYTNVHYLLNDEQRPQALRKIHQKLVPGGKVYVFSVKDGTYAEFTNVFGPPIKATASLKVFRKAD